LSKKTFGLLTCTTYIEIGNAEGLCRYDGEITSCLQNIGIQFFEKYYSVCFIWRTYEM